jgi:hypothetical protein
VIDFKKVYAINVNDWTEKKNNLAYLSWANAWAKFVEVYPNATYEVVKENGIPYFGNNQIGYMVYTKVTVEDLTHEMWLPVMDNNNKTMKFSEYTYDTKFKKDLKVEAVDMFAVNKAIMRCLTKNLAMFGLGLYIYAGEDIPNDEAEPQVKPKVEPKAEPKGDTPKKEPLPTDKIDNKKAYVLKMKAGEKFKAVLDYYKVDKAEDLNMKQWSQAMKKLDSEAEKVT